MRLGSTSSHRRPVQSVLFRQTQGMRIYQGEQRRTMVSGVAAIYRMLDATPVVSHIAGVESC